MRRDMISSVDIIGVGYYPGDWEDRREALRKGYEKHALDNFGMGIAELQILADEGDRDDHDYLTDEQVELLAVYKENEAEPDPHRHSPSAKSRAFSKSLADYDEIKERAKKFADGLTGRKPKKTRPPAPRGQAPSLGQQILDSAMHGTSSPIHLKNKKGGQ